MNTPEFCQNHVFSQFCFRNFFPEPRVMALGSSRNAWGLQTFRLIKPGFRLIKPGTPGPHTKSAQSPQSVPKSIPRTADFGVDFGTDCRLWAQSPPKVHSPSQSLPQSPPKVRSLSQSLSRSLPQSPQSDPARPQTGKQNSNILIIHISHKKHDFLYISFFLQ